MTTNLDTPRANPTTKEKNMSTTPNLRLFKIAYSNAKREAGVGWDLLGPRIQRALVAESALGVISGQDAELSGDSLRRVIDGMVAAMAQELPA